MIQSTPSANLQEELEALRRELRQVPVMEEDGAAAAAAGGDMRAEIERTLRELQDKLGEAERELQVKLGEAADEVEDMVAAHPYASVAAAFLLGILVANFLSRKG
jgi:ElaB/YqjD/DUF883 family membrane-anchored ribosome-binding protein